LSGILNPATTPFTISVWARLNTKLGTANQIILQQEGTSGRSLLYRDAATDKLGSYLGGVGTLSGTAVFADTDQWHHVCITYDSTTLKLYVDGVEDGSRTIVAESETSGFRLGAHKSPSSAYEYWDGFIDEVRIYERALSGSEVMMLAGGVTATDGRGMVNSDIAYQVSGNELELRIPRADMDQGSGTDPVAFDFHWADNMQNPYYIIEFAVSGDSAPNRRFNYRYDTAVSDEACQKTFDDGNGNNMDIDEDCDIDVYDLALFAEDWLVDPCNYNLDSFADLAEDWLLNYLPDELASETILEDDFEAALGNWTTDWDLVTSHYFSATHSVECSSNDNDLVSKDLDVVGRSSVRISFKYKVDDVDYDDNVYLQYYDGSSYDNIAELGVADEDVWLYYSDTIYNSGGDVQYFISNFKIKLEGSSIDSYETFWVDDVLITTTD